MDVTWVTATPVLSLAAKAAICHQIRLNWQRKSCRGMSAPFFALALLSYAAWTLDGLSAGDWGLVWGQGPGVLLCLAIAVQAFLYDWKGEKAHPWL